MSVQVKRRRETATFLSSFVGAQAELIVDTTNNRVQVHDGTTAGGWPAAKLSEVVTNTRTAVADANYTALTTDRLVAYTALSAARTVTLPASSAFPTGTQLTIVDESGACSATLTLTLSRAGSDTINGASTAVVASAYGYIAIESNGAGKWTIVDQTASLSGSGAVVYNTSQSLTSSQQTQGLANLGLSRTTAFRNITRNGNFSINQRAVSGTVTLAAGVYGHDGWKAGASGCTYTFSTGASGDTVLTISAGTLLQIVEGQLYVKATAYALSNQGTAQARIYQGSATGSYATASSASPLLATGVTAGTNTTIEFSTGTLDRIQLEPGSTATAFEYRDDELRRCLRYYWQTDISLQLLTYASAGGQGLTVPVYYKATMRVAPSTAGVSFVSSGNCTPSVGSVGKDFAEMTLTSSGAGIAYSYLNSGSNFSAEL